MTLEELRDELDQFSPACDICVRMELPFDGVEERELVALSCEYVNGHQKLYLVAEHAIHEVDR